MEFQSILQFLLKTRGMKQADLCRMTHIPSSLMSDYMNGKKSPALNNAMSIADAFGVTLDELTGRVAIKNPFLSPREEVLLHNFRQLDDRGKQTAEIGIETQIKLIKIINDIDKKKRAIHETEPPFFYCNKLSTELPFWFA